MISLESVIDGPAGLSVASPGRGLQSSVRALSKLRLSGIHFKGRFVLITFAQASPSRGRGAVHSKQLQKKRPQRGKC